jgi:L-lactate dehydrogenase complex protein LldF
MRQLAHIFASPKRYERAQRLGRRGQRLFMHDGVIDHLPGLLAGWTRTRDLQPLPRQTFRAWWRERERGRGRGRGREQGQDSRKEECQQGSDQTHG